VVQFIVCIEDPDSIEKILTRLDTKAVNPRVTATAIDRRYHPR
jgi:hypothetical protein